MSCCQQIQKAKETISPCTCPGPGYCPNARCVLNEHGYKLCRGTPGYFELWRDKATAPCMDAAPVPKRWLRLGDALAWLIHVVTLGRVKLCAACDSRRQKLNSFGFRLIDALRRLPPWRST